MGTLKASLQFLESIDKEAVFIANPAGEEIKPHQGQYQNIEVSLLSGRQFINKFSLDLEGFRLAKHPTAVKNFLNDDEVSDIYENELIELLKKQTGAQQVEVFDHTRRSTSSKTRLEKKLREGVFLVHNDYSSNSGIQRLKDYLAENPEVTTDVLKKQFAIVNVWRSMAGVVKNHTLALCDATSLGPNDLVSIKRKSDNREGEIQFAFFNEAQRWFYFPELNADEVLIFKTFDSQTDGRARFTPHTAFSNKNSDDDDFIRESIESRCFLFF
ncbi:MAG: methyltransferase [Cycloclasticus sp.]|nr:MAG: methyltransferase [Cycloclasticus sp.]